MTHLVAVVVGRDETPVSSANPMPVSGTVADGANVTFGAKADAANAATNTTAITAMSIWKQISLSIQAAAASLAATLTVTPAKSSTGTQSSVAGSASAVTILAANASRLGAEVFNESTATLYLILSSTTPSVTAYTVQVGPNGYYEVPSNYTGIIKGIWSSATGNARVTELT